VDENSEKKELEIIIPTSPQKEITIQIIEEQITPLIERELNY